MVGMGGIGKTTLGIMVCYSPRVQRHFSSGVVWLTIGNKSHDIANLQKVLLSRLLQGEPQRLEVIEKRIVVGRYRV